MRRWTERLAQRGDEAQQRLGVVGPALAPGLLLALRRPPALLGDPAGELAVPVRLPHDAGLPADALPPRRRDQVAVGAERRHVAEQRHQVEAAHAAAVEVEQLGQHPRHHPLVDGGARPPVPRQTGGGQVVLDEAGVGPFRGEEHGHAVEAGAGASTVEHGPDGDADLVVGVGRRHQPHGARRR